MVQKLISIAVYVVIGLIILVGGILSFIYLAYPKVNKAPDIQVNVTPERLSRGKYLAHHVAVCMDCHSERDWSRYSGPLKSHTLGKGGEQFTEDMGMPGTFLAKNITPYNLSSWTDGEIYRAITAGVDRDGEPIFSVMPHKSYGKLDKEDIYAIIAYLRSLKPVENAVADSEPSFPVNFLMRLAPEKSTPMKRPNPNDLVAYGKYMTTMAACYDCHTPMEKGQHVEQKGFAGGFVFQFPNGSRVISTNITPDNHTGIGQWTEQQFVQRFKQFTTTNLPEVEENEVNTVMPWSMYAGMSETDLRAIYIT